MVFFKTHPSVSIFWGATGGGGGWERGGYSRRNVETNITFLKGNLKFLFIIKSNYHK